MSLPTTTTKQGHLYALLAEHGPCTVRQIVMLEFAGDLPADKKRISRMRNIIRHKLTRLRGKNLVRLTEGGRWVVGGVDRQRAEIDPSDFQPDPDWQDEQQAWLASVQHAKSLRQQVGAWQKGYG